MAQYTAYANYVIYFSNPADYAAAVAICGGTGYGHCPATAAITFGLTFPPPGGPLGVKGMYGFAPYGIPTLGPGIEVLHPQASGVFLKSDVDSVLVPGQLGSPAIGPAGPDMLLKWWGYIVAVNPQAGGAEAPPVTPIPARRWIGGFEAFSQLEGVGGLMNVGSRDASRSIDGYGFPIRGANGITPWSRNVNEFNAGFTTRTSWERFYVRIKTLGTNDCGIWRSKCSTSVLSGAGIKISTLGEVLGYNLTSVPAEVLIGTAPTILSLDKWYLFDVLIKYPSVGADSGRLRVYINHTLEIDATVIDGTGIDTVGFHSASQLGQFTVAEDNWEIDLDDWICADIPNRAGIESLDSIDWQSGSHVRALNVTSGVLTGYAGNVQVMNQFFNAAIVSNSSLISTTALALMEGLTDHSDEQDFMGQVLGPVALMVASYTFQADASDGKLGYSIAGAAPVMATINENNTWVASRVLYNPPSAELPTFFAPLSLLKEKSNNVSQNTLTALVGLVEYIGAWGTEDYPGVAPVSDFTQLLIHNCRCSNTEWANVLGVPTAPMFAVGGTYVGNDDTQDINLPAPAHFIIIRGLAGANLAMIFQGASIGAHYGCAERYQANSIVRVWTDALGQAKFTVNGSDAQNNANGVTYQYVAFCDPGMRFNSCGAYNRAVVPATATIPLFDPNFTPQFGMIQKDMIGSNTTTIELTFKGQGHGANDGSLVTGVAKANWGSFAAGSLTVLADNLFATLKSQYNFGLWRTTDSRGQVATQIFSYVGNGGGARVINFPLATGRWPLLAMVLPHNSQLAFFRDPSHAGTNSCNLTALGNSATHITGGGADFINVGVSLNTNLVTYDVFIILGDSAGWNNGIFTNPSGPAEGVWPLPPYVPSNGPDVIPDGGLVLNGQPGLLMVKDLSGIYTLVPNKTCDTIYDKQVGQTELDIKIPDPFFKTGYIGG